MKLYDDLYCKNDSLHGGTRVTIVDQYEKTIFYGTFYYCVASNEETGVIYMSRSLDDAINCLKEVETNE